METGLDWVAGDELYFPPTASHPRHHDYLTVASYLPDTGRLVLTSAFEYYHFGAKSSTGDDYNGVDMRGLAILLTRNIVIQGDASNDWGCATLTHDRTEADRSVRTGTTIFDNVEMYRCGQADTFKTAIRFEGARKSVDSEIRNTVVWGGNAKNLMIKLSNNINVRDSSFIGGKQLSVIMTSTNNVHLDNIFVGDLVARPSSGAKGIVDKEGGVAFCSLVNNNVCPDSSVTNSRVAGVIYGGFIAPGHNCGATNTKFKNNVSHSNNGAGAYIYPDPESNLKT